jgi:hypothetical protein
MTSKWRLPSSSPALKSLYIRWSQQRCRWREVSRTSYAKATDDERALGDDCREVVEIGDEAFSAAKGAVLVL